VSDARFALAMVVPVGLPRRQPTIFDNDLWRVETAYFATFGHPSTCNKNSNSWD
jgi:hypothetical protein